MTTEASIEHQPQSVMRGAGDPARPVPAWAAFTAPPGAATDGGQPAVPEGPHDDAAPQSGPRTESPITGEPAPEPASGSIFSAGEPAAPGTDAGATAPEETAHAVADVPVAGEPSDDESRADLNGAVTDRVSTEGGRTDVSGAVTDEPSGDGSRADVSGAVTDRVSVEGGRADVGGPPADGVPAEGSRPEQAVAEPLAAGVVVEEPTSDLDEGLPAGEDATSGQDGSVSGAPAGEPVTAGPAVGEPAADGAGDPAPAEAPEPTADEIALAQDEAAQAAVAEQLGAVVNDVQADPGEFAAAAVLDVLRAAGWADAAEAAELRAEAERLRELLNMVVRDHRAREASAAENQQLVWLVPLLRAAHGVAFGTLGAKVALRTSVQDVPEEVLAQAGLRIDYGVEPVYEDDHQHQLH
jgi:hypothetical protein